MSGMVHVVSGRPWTRPATLRVWRAVALVSLALAAALAISAVIRTTPATRPAPAQSAVGVSALTRLPMTAQATSSTIAGAGVGAFAPRAVTGGFRLSGGGVAGVIGANGLVVRAVGGSLSLSGALIGRGTALQPLAGGAGSAPASIGGRVVLGGAEASEWFAAGPLGIEQGFTIAHRPGGGGSTMTVATRVGGTLIPRPDATSLQFLDRAGRVVLLYGGLSATDATGRPLRAWMTLSHRRLLLRIDDRGARYPLRIDPLVEQQKIAPTDAIVEPNYGSYFGQSVAISADGNTALIAGPNDGSNSNFDQNPGAVWVYTRTGATWSEQQKLTAPDEIGTSSGFGDSVALSGDGKTALIGGASDNANGNGAVGAAWVYTQSNGTWSELQKIVPTDEAGVGSDFGTSVALSTDGSTALIGGLTDGADLANQLSDTGAAWVYTLSNGSYTELQKIVPPDESTPCATDAGSPTSTCSEFGSSVALSATGATAVIGGPNDNANSGGAGAAWVYTRSGNSYTELQKIVPTDNLGSATDFGNAVALSSDGSTALIGGDNDNNNGADGGAAWVYTLGSVSYAEQQKIVPMDESAAGFPDPFGWSVALSSDGNTALIGSPYDSSAAPTCDDSGAAWLYTRASASWTEQQKIVPTDENQCGSEFGFGVALSQDASTALIGGVIDGANGAAWTYVTGSADADLSVSVSAPASAADGTSFQATVTVDNKGPAVATGVRTTLLLPLALKLTNAGGASGFGPIWRWLAATIPSGGQVTYTVTLQVRANQNRKVKLLALTRSPAVPDPNLTNNVATAPVALGTAAGPLARRPATRPAALRQ